MTYWPQDAGLVLLGLFAGGYGTMVGLGGGFMLVPAFLFLGYDPRVAAGTSMAVVFANGVSATISYLRQRRVDVRSGIIFGIAGIPGSWLGALVDQWLPQRLFSFLFAVLLAWVAIRLGTTGAQTHRELVDEALAEAEPRPGLDDASRGVLARDFVDAQGVRHAYRYNVAGAVALSFCGGFVASSLGIGGGVIQMPAMIYSFGFPPHVAAATSHLIIAITAFFGTASHALYGDVDWQPALFVAVGAIAGAQIGARLAKRVAAAPLMRLLAVASAVAAVKLFWSALAL